MEGRALGMIVDERPDPRALDLVAEIGGMRSATGRLSSGAFTSPSPCGAARLACRDLVHATPLMPRDQRSAACPPSRRDGCNAAAST
jgi:hypothetical protein